MSTLVSELNVTDICQLMRLDRAGYPCARGGPDGKPGKLEDLVRTIMAMPAEERWRYSILTHDHRLGPADIEELAARLR